MTISHDTKSKNGFMCLAKHGGTGYVYTQNVGNGFAKISEPCMNRAEDDMEQNGDWSRYSAAMTAVNEIAAKYGINGHFVGEEELKKNIELMEEYGFYKVKNFVGGNFELRFVNGRYRLTNTVFTDKSIPEPKWFLLLENGNVGAYSICRYEDRDWVASNIYERLREKLNALSYKYDPLNSYWLFVPSQDTAEQVEKLVRGAIDEVKSERLARRRERLLTELAELDAVKNGGVTK